MKQIGILNGPNLNRLGKREPDIYGHDTLADLQARLEKAAASSAKLDFYQSNHEGELIDKVSAWAEAGLDGVIVNPAGLTHTSVALRDALAGSDLRCIEVHISNIYRREDFRQKSVTAGACEAVISGMGLSGYDAALHYLTTQ